MTPHSTPNLSPRPRPPRARRGRLVTTIALLALAAGCSSADGGCASPEARILFLGNSHTSVNDLPAVFTGLALAGGHRVETAMIAPGGQTLQGHAQAAETTEALRSSHWDWVVLQEQSQIPSVEEARRFAMDPAVRTLARMAREAGATPLLFMTWGRRDGWPERGMADFEAMEREIESGTLEIARGAGVAVAPVGAAWRSARVQAPDIDLWSPDGSHPSPAGTYLAACVLCAAVLRDSPEGLDFAGPLPASDAGQLQRIGAETVLSSPASWSLPQGGESQ